MPAALAAWEPISPFARNVALHVPLHEPGHAVFREFGVPILAAEETMADSFATTMLTQLMVDDAVAVVSDRARSWMIEDAEPVAAGLDLRGEMRAEHDLDLRRAHQALCLLYGADPAEWAEATAWVGFTADELAVCSDTEPDQIDGWGKVLAPHILPPDDRSANVEAIYGEGPMAEAMRAAGVMEQVAEVARRLDWSDPIVLHFHHCDVGGSWSRDDRTVLLCDDDAARFVAQGEKVAAQA